MKIKNPSMKIKMLFIIIMFLLGIYFIYNFPNKEGFDTKKCPNVLIREGDKYILFNNKLATIPGVNPMTFDHLGEYVEFLEWQRSQKIQCPVLYLQKTIDAQGNDVYAIRPSPTDPQGGLPHVNTSPKGIASVNKLYDAGRDDPPFNCNSFPGYDKQNQYIGKTVPLDKM